MRPERFLPHLLAALALWWGVASAHAEEAVPDGWRPGAMYFRVYGGFAIAHDSEMSRFGSFYTVEPDAVAEFDIGPMGGGAVGYDSGRGWRLEIDVALRDNSFDTVQWNRYFKYGNYPTSGRVVTTAYMVNYIFSPPPGPGFQGYFGVGIGGARYEFKDVFDDDGALFTRDESSFAYQFLAGLEFPITENLALTLGYTLFGTTLSIHVDPGQPEIGGDRIHLPMMSSNLQVGLSLMF